MNPIISLTLFFFVLPFLRIIASEDCAPRTCGGVPIRYPFWLSGQQPSLSGGQPYLCSPPPFEVACRNRTDGTWVPVVRVFDSDLYVKDIFYDNRSLRLTSARFVEDACPFAWANLTADFYPYSLSSSNKMIYFLSNCTNSTNLPSYPRIICPSPGGYFAGVHEASDGPHLEPAAGSCKLLVVPTVEYGQGNFSELLRTGWLLNWTVTDCTPCLESGGQCGYDGSRASFICICSDRNHFRSCQNGGVHPWRWKTIIGSTFGGLGCLCLLLLILLRCRRKVLNEKNDRAVKALLSSHGLSLIPKNYKYSEIKRMTRSFSSKLGQGGYGTVYKGTLKDGHQVAVKLLRTGAKGNGEEFINEVASISRTSHVNIVSLLGFCMERSKRALVYEFMPNGSLEKFISSENGGGGAGGAPLGWEKLFEIVVGIARGLEYLHRGCSTRIVHFDIKPHNILLDQDFCPKISDFGLAKLCSPKESSGFSTMTPRGTIGYIAPEVFSRNFGTVSSKSDVYSYGMMVLEMVGVTTMKKNDAQVMGSSTCSEFYFPHWIYDRLGGTSNLLGSIAGLGTEKEEEMVRKMAIVGLWCIQTMPVDRPSMSVVVDMLEGRSTQDLEMPPKP